MMMLLLLMLLLLLLLLLLQDKVGKSEPDTGMVLSGHRDGTYDVAFPDTDPLRDVDDDLTAMYLQLICVSKR